MNEHVSPVKDKGFQSSGYGLPTNDMLICCCFVVVVVVVVVAAVVVIVLAPYSSSAGVRRLLYDA